MHVGRSSRERRRDARWPQVGLLVLVRPRLWLGLFLPDGSRRPLSSVPFLRHRSSPRYAAEMISYEIFQRKIEGDACARRRHRFFGRPPLSLSGMYFQELRDQYETKLYCRFTIYFRNNVVIEQQRVIHGSSMRPPAAPRT